MKYFYWITAVLLILALSQSSVTGDTDDAQLIRHVDALDRQITCDLAVRKIFSGDTDRGMEATLNQCANGIQRIEIIFGLSRKDLIFRCLLVKGSAAKAEVLERKYRSTADGNVDFHTPVPPSSRGVLHFDGVRLVAISPGQTLDITDKNKNAKSLAFINLVNAVRTALLSSDPHPEFDSMFFLTGLFGNG